MGTLQRRILALEIRSTYYETRGKCSFVRLTPTSYARLSPFEQAAYAENAQFLENVYTADVRYLRPDKELPVETAAFDDQVAIGQDL